MILRFKNQSGAASIILTMIMLTSMFFVALTVNNIVQNGIIMSRAHINSTKAYFAAEAGMERTLWQIRKSSSTQAFNPTLLVNQANWLSGSCVYLTHYTSDSPSYLPYDFCNVPCDSTASADLTRMYVGLSNGSKYKVKYENLANVATFSSTGIYQDITKRVVQTKYQF